MPCYKPLTAWRAQGRTQNGKSVITFDASKALFPNDPLQLPCGQCIGCRLKRSREWAIRCVHEAQFHTDNSFITLTFDEENLVKRRPLIGSPKKPDERIPGDMFSLDKSEFQKFMKRLRKHFNGKQIRYFHCGEYGSQLGRPHYHAILFGIDFQDKYLFQIRNGNPLYRSPTLEKLWTHGYSSIGSVTFESAAYVARYCMKKATGLEALDNYYAPDENTGELVQILEPEYTTMSTKPGIGTKWFEKYMSDVYPSDFITHNGKKYPAPKFYDKLLERMETYDLEIIKTERKKQALKHKENQTPERLAVQEKCKLNQIKSLQRTLDNG